MSHIIELRARNYRKLQAVWLRLGPGCTTIKGRNSQGKSTLVTLPQVLLGGKKEVPLQPIRDGARKCEMSMIVGTDGEPELIIKKTIRANGAVDLEVTDPDGKPRRTPQELLDALVGTSLAFDPVSFSAMKPKEQDELLREALGLDFADLDAERDAVMVTRKGVNKEVKALRSVLEIGAYHKGVPSEPVDVAETAAELRSRNLENVNREKALASIERSRQALAEHDRTTARLEAEVEELERKLAELRHEILDAAARRETMLAGILTAEQELPLIRSTAELEAALATADATNQKIRENAERRAREAELEAKEAEADRHTERLDEIKELRQTRLAGAKYTIPGLSFDDAGPILNGVPLSQAGTAETLRLGVSLVAAMDPPLRCVYVRNGDVLDSEGKALFDALLAEHNMQALMEVVHLDDPTALVIEDGLIREPDNDGTTVAAE